MVSGTRVNYNNNQRGAGSGTKIDQRQNGSMCFVAPQKFRQPRFFAEFDVSSYTIKPAVAG
jgi:hypothetical protein